MRKIYSDIKLFLFQYAIVYGSVALICLFIPKLLSSLLFYVSLLAIIDATKLIMENILVRRYNHQTLDINLGITKIRSEVLLNQVFTTATFSNNAVLINVPMLIDTGCDGGIVLDRCLVKKLNLIPTGKEMNVFSMTGKSVSKCYKADLKIGNKLLKNIMITESNCDSEGHHKGLIGMDIISQGELIVKKENGKFIYSFTI